MRSARRKAEKKAPNLIAENKDVILSIGYYLPLKNFFSLSLVCKSFRSWLKDPRTSNSWKKRIKTTFPRTSETIFKKSLSQQIAKLNSFGSIASQAEQISCFEFDPVKTEDQSQGTKAHWFQLNRSTFICQYGNSVSVYSTSTGTHSRMEVEWINFDIFCDYTSERVGFRNQKEGHLKIYSVSADGSLTPVTEHKSDTLTRRIFNQIYGDYIIERAEDSLVWHSLVDNSVVRSIDLPQYAGDVEFALSTLKPVIYMSQGVAQYDVFEIDCLLQSETLLKKVFSSTSTVWMDNEGDGIESIKLIENESGRVLNVRHEGTGDRAVDFYDLEKNQMVFHTGYEHEYRKYYFSPGSSFAAVLFYNHKTTAVQSTDENANDIIVKEELIDDDYIYSGSESSFASYREEDYEKAYWIKRRIVTNVKWLDNDILTFSTSAKSNSCHFFSIKKRGILGTLKDKICAIFKTGDQIIGFTPSNRMYIITMPRDFVDQTLLSKAKKRQRDELSDEEKPQAKKRKVNKKKSK